MAEYGGVFLPATALSEIIRAISEAKDLSRVIMSLTLAWPLPHVRLEIYVCVLKQNNVYSYAMGRWTVYMDGCVQIEKQSDTDK